MKEVTSITLTELRLAIEKMKAAEPSAVHLADTMLQKPENFVATVAQLVEDERRGSQRARGKEQRVKNREIIDAYNRLKESGQLPAKP
jgi:hypothetical protein